MPNGTVLSIFTRSRRGLLTTICASITLLYLALVIALACAWPPSAPVPSSDNASAFSFIDRTALNCIFGIVFSFWGVMAYLRCLDPRISRRLAAIAVILTLWLTAVTIKMEHDRPQACALPLVRLLHPHGLSATALPFLRAEVSRH